MLKIVDSKKEKKKYTNAVETFFRLYRMKESINSELPGFSNFFKILKAVESGELFASEPVKKKIIEKHLLGDYPLPALGKHLGISTSHMYNLHRDIIKDFAMLMFEVIIL